MIDEFHTKTASNEIFGRHLPSGDTNLSSNEEWIGGELIIFGFKNLPQSSFKPIIAETLTGIFVNSFHFLSDKLHCFVSLKDDTGELLLSM